MGVESMRSNTSTPTLTLPLHGGGDVVAPSYSNQHQSNLEARATFCAWPAAHAAAVAFGDLPHQRQA